jgi:hypothetical protein
MRADVKAVRTHTLPILDMVDVEGEPVLDMYELVFPMANLSRGAAIG